MNTQGIGRWLKSNRRKVLVHAFILGNFLLYSVFLAGPLFDRLEAMPGEARLVKAQLPGVTNTVQYSLERVVATPSALEIHGWAFIEGVDAENSSTFLVLRSQKTTYVFETSRVFAPYVTSEYEESNINLDWSGFITVIPARKIEKGDYAIGLYIKKEGVQALGYTDRAIVRSRDDLKLAVLAQEPAETDVSAEPVPSPTPSPTTGDSE